MLIEVVLPGRGGEEHELLDLERKLERLGAPAVVLRYLREHVVRLVVAQHALDAHDAAGAEAAQVIATSLSPRRVAVVIVDVAGGVGVTRAAVGGYGGWRHDGCAIGVHVDWDWAALLVQMEVHRT